MIKNKHLFIVAVLLFPFVVISFAVDIRETNFLLGEVYGPPSEYTSIPEPEYSIKVKLGDKIETLELDQYVVGVVAGEMPASFEVEALKAQAVASRTFALYKKSKSNGEYDLTGDVNGQVYLDETAMRKKWENEYDKYYNKILAAVEATKNEVITYNDELIESFYFAMSSGKTNESVSVFGENRDYLQSVNSDYDNDSLKGYMATVTFTKDEFKQKLSLSCEQIVIGNIKRSSNGYVETIDVCAKNFKGTQVRSLLGLRSANFEISVGDSVTITTKGYGHGVGMSQYGANGYANAGYTYEDIIKHYYTGVQISDLKNV